MSSILTVLADAVTYLMLAGLILLAVYVVVRVGSFAYYRTKLEHFRRTMGELKKEEDKRHVEEE